jgi:hypothetical protein
MPGARAGGASETGVSRLRPGRSSCRMGTTEPRRVRWRATRVGGVPVRVRRDVEWSGCQHAKLTVTAPRMGCGQVELDEPVGVVVPAGCTDPDVGRKLDRAVVAERDRDVVTVDGQHPTGAGERHGSWQVIAAFPVVSRHSAAVETPVLLGAGGTCSCPSTSSYPPEVWLQPSNPWTVPSGSYRYAASGDGIGQLVPMRLASTRTERLAKTYRPRTSPDVSPVTVVSAGPESTGDVVRLVTDDRSSPRDATSKPAPAAATPTAATAQVARR